MIVLYADKHGHSVSHRCGEFNELKSDMAQCQFFNDARVFGLLFTNPKFNTGGTFILPTIKFVSGGLNVLLIRWLKFYVRVCSWGLNLQFYSTDTVNKEMCP
jgi:hypothetical protein